MVPPASDKISRVSPYSGSRWASSRFRIRDLHPLRSAFQCRSPTMILAVSRSFNPRPRSGLGSSPFARRYLGNHSYFLFLQVLRCFSSLSLASLQLSVHCRISGLYPGWVPPFGHRRIVACLLLPVAFRCLLRPSSPLCA